MKIKTKKIPGKFRKYFWDCDFRSITIKEHLFFITERILNFGNMESLQWLLRHTDQESIRDVIKKSRNLSAKTKFFWVTILHD